MQVVYSQPPGPGWEPIGHLARLAAELLGGELTVLAGRGRPGRGRQLAALLPRRRRRAESCLLICPGPPDLLSILDGSSWRPRFDRVAAWVVDSFWIERIPRLARLTRLVDLLFITDRELLAPWEAALRVPAAWLPWGADVLRLGSGGADRPVDLQRIGRQPPGWDRDDETAGRCAALGLVFRGRPPLLGDPSASARALAEAFGHAKFTLAFSNRVSPAPYTHPTREYLTGRWVDALAAGAVVAGVPPACDATRELLWPEALLDLGDVEPARGLQRISEAVRAWRPEIAEVNHRRALERLDWRWRLERLADALGEPAPRLRAELAALRALIARASGSSA